MKEVGLLHSTEHCLSHLHRNRRGHRVHFFSILVATLSFAAVPTSAFSVSKSTPSFVTLDKGKMKKKLSLSANDEQNMKDEYPNEAKGKIKMVKKIFCCFDGSGLSPEHDTIDIADDTTGFSNVFRLHVLAGGSLDNERADVPGQKSLYVRGVGQIYQGVPNPNNLVGKYEIQQFEMTKMLKKHYEEGDSLYLVGFSRGAAAARDYASKLHKDGLEIDGKKYHPEVKMLVVCDTCSMNIVSSEFFDIVKNLIFKSGYLKPDDLGEKDGVLAPNVKKAVHIVMVDEPRSYTSRPPTLFGVDDERVTEIWFPGSHNNAFVGSFKEGLSDTALEFLINRFNELDEADRPTLLSPDAVNIHAFDGLPEEKTSKTYMEIVPGFTNVSFPFNVPKKPGLRVLGVYKDGKVDTSAEIKVHESVYDFINWKVNDKKDEMYKNPPANESYNHALKDANFKVYGQDMKEIPEKTEKLKELLKEHA